MGTISGTANPTLTSTEQEWLARANEQLASFESTIGEELDKLQRPPAGDQAARRRELRRRARIELLPRYLRDCLDQVRRTREALNENPQAGRAVYHALMAGVLSQYSHAADVRASRVTKREGGIEGNHRKKNPT